MIPACKTIKHKKIFPSNEKDKSVMIWMEAGSVKMDKLYWEDTRENTDSKQAILLRTVIENVKV